MLIIDHCNKCQNIRLISEGSHDMKTGVMMLKIQIWHYRIKLHFYLALSIITKDNDKKIIIIVQPQKQKLSILTMLFHQKRS